MKEDNNGENEGQNKTVRYVEDEEQTEVPPSQ